MATKIFVNLPVMDLKRSVGFFSRRRRYGRLGHVAEARRRGGGASPHAASVVRHAALRGLPVAPDTR